MVTKHITCDRCVMSWPDDPDIWFDKQGICRYCLAWDAGANERRVAVSNRPWVIEAIKKAGKDKQYDAIMGLSGGVDSSLALHLAIEQGLRVYTYNVDNGYNTPASDENIMRMVETLKVPFYRYVLDKERFDELYRTYLLSGLKNLEVITDHILMAVSYELAVKHGVGYILSGANVATESIMPESYGYQPRDLEQIKAVYRQFTGKELTGLPTISMSQYWWYRSLKRIKVVPILDSYEYNREKAIELLEQKYGYKNYGAKHTENRLTKWFQEVYLPQKFGIDKRRPHLSSLINSGQITREEALQELQKGLPIFTCPIPSGDELWREVLQKDWRKYPNNAKTWQKWSRFFNVLKKLGWKW